MGLRAVNKSHFFELGLKGKLLNLSCGQNLGSIRRRALIAHAFRSKHKKDYLYILGSIFQRLLPKLLTIMCSLFYI